jgi:predicted transcriptional regulator of viral defense system
MTEVRRRVAEIAAAQAGVIERAQLIACGVGGSTISRWVERGLLRRVHPRVYTTESAALSTVGRLRAALLYAGRGSALSHQTACWWHELVDAHPETIHVRTPHNRPSLPYIRLHRAPSAEAIELRGLPVVPVADALLDVAAVLPRRAVRRALAEADFRGVLDLRAIDEAARRGRPGSAALRAALADHLPELARTRSPLEDEFLLLVERAGMPFPEVNVVVHGHEVDCLWRAERVVVELDGVAAHGSAARVNTDRRRDLGLRAARYRVRRYSWRQVTREPAAVAADLRAALAP